jgi:hypothetical protein
LGQNGLKIDFWIKKEPYFSGNTSGQILGFLDDVSSIKTDDVSSTFVQRNWSGQHIVRPIKLKKNKDPHKYNIKT